MAIYVNTENEINKNHSKATKEFTDRVEPRRLFWTKYNIMKDAISVNNELPIQIITYYGIGGVGKSRLLSQIRTELAEKEKEAKFCFIDFEKIKNLTTAGEEMLNYIKNDLSRKYNFEFPLYDLAYYEYNIRSGMPASKPELESILSGHDQLNFLMNVMGEIPLVGTFAKIVQYADEGSTILKNRFNNKKLKEKILELDNMSLDEIKDMLPYYFAMDMKYNLSGEKCPFILEIDTYEKLVNELTQVGSIRDIDEWLKGPNGLIQNIPNILWVVAGREKLKWGEYDKDYEVLLDQHLLGDLSEGDCKFFLNSAGIYDNEIINQIYNLTGGVPIFLDMCVDTYFKLLEENKVISIKDFEGDKVKLIERFFRYMNDQEKDFITILSFIGNWNDDEIEDKIKGALGYFSYSLYEKIKEFSFVLHENNKYKIHDTIRKVIIENAPSIMKKKFNDSVKNNQEKKIEEIKEKIEEEVKNDVIVTESKKIDNVKEYENIINELVSDINNFLITNPPDDKENRMDYCDKINNLIKKIIEYLMLFDKVYNYGNLNYIIKNKRFKNTHEYLIINGLYLCLKRYYCSVSYDTYIDPNKKRNLNIYEDYHAAYKDNIYYYNKTRGFYKNEKDKTKHIDYSIMFMSKIIFNEDKKLYFDKYELDRLSKIIKKHHKEFSNSSFSNMYLYFATKNIENLKKYLDKFREICQKQNNLFYKRWNIIFSINVLYYDIKNLRDNIDSIVDKRISKSSYIDEKSYIKDRNKIISETTSNVLNKSIDYIISNLNDDNRLIDGITLSLLIDLTKLIKYNSYADSNCLKIIDLLFEKCDYILNTNNKNSINTYNTLIYKLSYFKCNDESSLAKYISILERIRKKMIELYGKNHSITEKATYEYLSKLSIKCYGYLYPKKYLDEENSQSLISGSKKKLKNFYIKKLEVMNYKFSKDYSVDIENILDVLSYDFDITTSVFFKSMDKKLYKKDLDYMIEYFVSCCVLARQYNKYEYLNKTISIFKELIDKQDGVIKTYDEYYIFNDSLLKTITCYNIYSFKNLNEYLKFYDYLFNESILSFSKCNVYLLELAITILTLAKLTYDMYLTDKDIKYLENNNDDKNDFVYKVFIHLTSNVNDLAASKPTKLILENYNLSTKRRIFGKEKEYSKLVLPFYTIVSNNNMKENYYDDIIKIKNKEQNTETKQIIDIYIRCLKNLEKIKTLK